MQFQKQYVNSPWNSRFGFEVGCDPSLYAKWNRQFQNVNSNLYLNFEVGPPMWSRFPDGVCYWSYLCVMARKVPHEDKHFDASVYQRSIAAIERRYTPFCNAIELCSEC